VVTGHLEIETKYDVDEAFVVPAFDDLPGVAVADQPVEHRLEAIYHDTTDLRLLRSRVTLRRRTGGPDAGWHLKLPAGTARRELHAPLGRATKNPPQALLGPVTGLLRGAPTAPVVVLRTGRTVTLLRDDRGRVLAEVADDAVTASVPATGPGEPAQVRAWREIEVELVDGDEELAATVGERLVCAGARPAAAASKLGRVLSDRLVAPARRRTEKEERKRGPAAGDAVLDALRRQVADLESADVLLRTDQPDAVHQLRVSARRLRSTLAAFRDLLDPAGTTPVRAELAWLGGRLAGARDDEVALAHLRELVAAEPVELVLGPVAARLQRTAMAATAAGVDRALETLSEPRYLALLDVLQQLLVDPPLSARADEDFAAVSTDAVHRAGKRLRRRLRTARHAGDTHRSEALHQVRTAAKRLRYVTEVAEGEVSGVRPLVKAAKRAQRVLGEAQDSVVTREHCRQLGVVAAAAAGENSFSYGRLHALEQARAERAEAEFWAGAPELRRLLRRFSR
jgi:CHAD domain-containing protein